MQASFKDLVSENHAWILPGYYNLNWWKLQNESPVEDGECSNEEMESILESVIFINSVKFPPVVMKVQPS